MIKRFLSLLLLSALILSCVSCADTDIENDETVYIEDLELPSYKSGQVITLNVYNWGEYISDGSEGTLDVNEEFETYFNSSLSEKYGGIKIKIEYSTYATNEDMYSKLKNSAVSYDIVVPSDYMIQKMISENMLYGFNTSSKLFNETVTHYGNISDDFKNTYYDPDNCFSVPYTYGMVGIIYNTRLVDEADVAEKSWSILWNEKYAGNILQFNNPRDAFATAMYWKGLDVNSEDPEVWDQVLELMKEQKPILQGYVNDEIFNKMQSESAAIAPYYVGDFLTMASMQENLAFYYPTEGTNYFIDAMCIPKSSRNPHLALEYINFLIDKEAAVANAEYIGYASPNNAVVNDADYRDGLGEEAYNLLYNNLPKDINEGYNALFPDTTEPACYRSFTPDVQSYVNTLWENLKIEGSTELWVHITTFVIIAAVVVYAGINIYLKKKRSAFYRKKSK